MLTLLVRGPPKHKAQRDDIGHSGLRLVLTCTIGHMQIRKASYASKCVFGFYQSQSGIYLSEPMVQVLH